MARIHFFEIEDLSWCPDIVHSGVTDALRFIADKTKGLNPIAPLLRSAIQTTQTDRILDIGSGSGGPWLTLIKEIQSSDKPVKVTLTDIKPNLESFKYVSELDKNIDFIAEPFDGTEIPESIPGFLTSFNSLHHLKPSDLKLFLENAIKQKRGIALFDGEDKKLLGSLVMLLSFPMLFLLIPFVRPFSKGRLFFTYIIPLIPIVILFDGIVSFLRTYSKDELLECLGTVAGEDEYDWEVGVHRVEKNPFGISYLIGTPKRG